jgi:hypothetical protein
VATASGAWGCSTVFIDSGLYFESLSGEKNSFWRTAAKMLYSPAMGEGGIND